MTRIQPNRTAPVIALSLSLAVSCTSRAQEGPRWETVDGPSGKVVSRIVLPHQTVSPDQASYLSEGNSLEISCVREKASEYTVQVSFHIPRENSGLPADMAQIDWRIMGPAQCPGPAFSWEAPLLNGKLTVRTVHTTVTLNMAADIDFLQSDKPVARRTEPLCEVTTHSLHPTEAIITATSIERGARAGAVLDLLSSADAVEVVLEIGGKEERQQFPLLGAAAAIAQAKRICESR